MRMYRPLWYADCSFWYSGITRNDVERRATFIKEIFGSCCRAKPASNETQTRTHTHTTSVCHIYSLSFCARIYTIRTNRFSECKLPDTIILILQDFPLFAIMILKGYKIVIDSAVVLFRLIRKLFSQNSLSNTHITCNTHFTYWFYKIPSRTSFTHIHTLAMLVVLPGSPDSFPLPSCSK